MENLGCKFYVSADLGQAQDYTALCVLRSKVEDSESDVDIESGNPIKVGKLDIIHLERHLGWDYNDVAERIRTLKSEPRLRETEYWHETRNYTESYPTVCIDKTGVGRGVSDILKNRHVSHVGITITGPADRKVTKVPGGYNIPKIELVTETQVALLANKNYSQNGKVVSRKPPTNLEYVLRWNPDLPYGKTLYEEIQGTTYAMNNQTGNLTYEQWRSKDHDDLCLAVCMATFLAKTLPKSSLHSAR
jgi:hypothetical protein